MRSMTGYGSGRADAPAARLTVEVRGVNQRFLDVKVAAPREYAAWESELRARVRAQAERGRIELTVTRIPVAAKRRYRVAAQRELARAYVAEARALGRTLGMAGPPTLADVLRLPELLQVSERPPELGAELSALRRAVATALAVFDRERRREGGHLARDMRQRTTALVRTVARIRRRLPQALAALRERVHERVARLLGGIDVDRDRVVHEVVALSERGDITEELVRLDSHLAALAAAVRERGPVGKRIEFLLQEVHREFNTIGSKTADLTIGELVLAAKGEVEKLREQVQNIE